MGFAATTSTANSLRACPEFERMLIRAGITLIKYWFSVSDEEQEKRFRSGSTPPSNAGVQSHGSRSPAPAGWNTPAPRTTCSPTHGHARQSLVRGGGGRQAPRPASTSSPTLLGKVPYEAIHYMSPSQAAPIKTEGYERPLSSQRLRA